MQRQHPDHPRSLKEKIVEYFSGVKTGRVQDINLTWGGDGNQVMTINGVQYATWIDYTKWPTRGDVVVHKPFYLRNKYGHSILCTDIIENKTNLRNANTFPADDV